MQRQAKVIKALAALRYQKERMQKHPRKLVKEYVEHWENELGAEGRPWSWRDVSRTIGFHKFKSMLRMFVLLGEIERLLPAGEVDRAHAQTVQGLKAVHQFNSDGSWRAAWPLTHLPDPLLRPRNRGTEPELEAVLGYLKTQEDINRRVKGTGNVEDLVPDDDEPPKGKGKTKKERAEAAKAARAEKAKADD